MSRPIFTPDTDRPYADHILAVAEAIAAVLREGAAPEPASVSIAEHCTTITPWKPGAPLTGLLAWAHYLTGAEWEAQVHPPLPSSDRPAVTIYVRGQLDGHPCELIGSSWRGLPAVDLTLYGQRQPLDVGNVRQLAALEWPHDDEAARL